MPVEVGAQSTWQVRVEPEMTADRWGNPGVLVLATPHLVGLFEGVAVRAIHDRLEPGQSAGPAIDYLYEPAPEQIFKDLLPRHVQVQVYRSLLESNAAFFAAQMTAMDAATRNSSEMIDGLTLYMNKLRQAAITREIIEVVSGSQAR